MSGQAGQELLAHLRQSLPDDDVPRVCMFGSASPRMRASCGAALGVHDRRARRTVFLAQEGEPRPGAIRRRRRPERSIALPTTWFESCGSRCCPRTSPDFDDERKALKSPWRRARRDGRDPPRTRGAVGHRRRSTPRSRGSRKIGGPVDIVHLVGLCRLGLTGPQIYLPNPEGKGVDSAIRSRSSHTSRTIPPPDRCSWSCNWWIGGTRTSRTTSSSSRLGSSARRQPQCSPCNTRCLPMRARSSSPSSTGSWRWGCPIGTAVQAARRKFRTGRRFGTPVLYLQTPVDPQLIRSTLPVHERTREATDRKTTIQTEDEAVASNALSEGTRIQEKLLDVLDGLPATPALEEMRRFVNETPWPDDIDAATKILQTQSREHSTKRSSAGSPSACCQRSPRPRHDRGPPRPFERSCRGRYRHAALPQARQQRRLRVGGTQRHPTRGCCRAGRVGAHHAEAMATVEKVLTDLLHQGKVARKEEAAQDPYGSAWRGEVSDELDEAKGPNGRLDAWLSAWCREVSVSQWDRER